MFGIGMPELLIILVVALIVFGPNKLPEVGKSMGRAVREFKKAINEFKQSMDVDTDLTEVKKAFDEIKGDVKETIEIKPKPEPEKKTEIVEKTPEHKESQ